jgi:hypothetical protein
MAAVISVIEAVVLSPVLAVSVAGAALPGVSSVLAGPLKAAAATLSMKDSLFSGPGCE